MVVVDESLTNEIPGEKKDDHIAFAEEEKVRKRRNLS